MLRAHNFEARHKTDSGGEADCILLWRTLGSFKVLAPRQNAWQRHSVANLAPFVQSGIKVRSPWHTWPSHIHRSLFTFPTCLSGAEGCTVSLSSEYCTYNNCNHIITLVLLDTTWLKRPGKTERINVCYKSIKTNSSLQHRFTTKS